MVVLKQIHMKQMRLHFHFHYRPEQTREIYETAKLQYFFYV